MTIHDAEYYRNYYKNNESRRKKVAERRNRIKKENAQYLSLLKDQPCKDCGIKYPPYVMQFDHLKDKEINLGNSQVRFWSRKRIDQEVAKCEIVCANCHFERTYQRRINGSVAEID